MSEKTARQYLKNLKIILLFLSFLGWTLPSFATPPARVPTWDNPITAYITFPAGFFPDSDGLFEIEVYCEAHFDIEWISLNIAHTEEITFDEVRVPQWATDSGTIEEELPRFEGKMRAGESKVWRIKGTVHGTAKIDDLKIPASVNLIVKYLFPHEAVLKDIEKRHAQDIDMKRFLLQELERVKGKTITIMKPIPVAIPKSLSPK